MYHALMMMMMMKIIDLYSALRIMHCQRVIANDTNQWRRQRSEGDRSFRGQKIFEPGHPDALFPQKKLTTFFSCRPQNTGRQRRFSVKIKQIKRSDMVTFLFSVHTITEAKQYTGSEPGLEPGQWIFQPGHLTWRALV